MSIWLLLALAVLTYGSRAAPLVLLPRPGETFRRLLDRVPAPLFAGLAAVSLFDPAGAPAPVPRWRPRPGGSSWRRRARCWRSSEAACLLG
ncbi:MAG TPA: hypothetical protein VHL78_08575 [Actinomycetota bacterium]|nr:hypothetical protein [Actinomycetota bacterium]